MDDTRELGVDFENLEPALSDEDYPLRTDELLERHGDKEVEHANGSEPLREVLAGTDDTYDDPEAVEQAVLNFVGDEAVGDTDYSERGTAVEEGEETDAL